MSQCGKGNADPPESKTLHEVHQLGTIADSQMKGELDLQQNQNDALNVLEDQHVTRKSTRPRKLTEKGKDLHMDKLKSLLLRFNDVYECWKVIAKVTKRSVEQNHPSDIIQEHVVRIEKELAELNQIYDAYRKVDTPAHDMRSKLDKSTSITSSIIQNAQSRMQGDDIELLWPEDGSVFASSTSSICLSVTKGCGTNSFCSNDSLARRKEAEAQYAATRAVLNVMSEQEQRQEELDALQAKDKQIVADQEAAALSRRLWEEKEELDRKIKRQTEEAVLLKKQQEENATRRQSVDNLRRELDRLEKLKQLNSAIAKLHVYNEANVDMDQGLVSQKLDIPMSVQSAKQSDHVSNVQPSDAPSGGGMSSDAQDLVKVLAEAISANRLPVPEPTVFYGDPLKFNHWKSSFRTLIERKNILDTEKMFFLEKYVGGAAKEALEGYFLLQSKDSYSSAWNLLDERYGQPFVIAKAFRDKLYAWPCIDARDSTALRKYVDFLRSCECVMSQNTNLHTLNDPVENQKLVLKLPEHLCQRWNRKATLYQLEHERFPNFSYFVTFLSMEASIACNPVTSQHAIWASEPEKSKTKTQVSTASRTQTVDAKSFSTNINDNWVTCIFCKKTAHSLQKCYKFLEQPVAERVKFIQHEHLCFGCLNPGHQSRTCKRRLICNSCSRRHPTCLHEDRPDQESKQIQAIRQEGSTSQPTTAETTSNRILKNGSSSQTSAIVPVIVSSNSGKEVLVYALLDSQSDSSFILQHVADALDIAAEPIKLKLSTMSSRETLVTCQMLKGLQIRGLNSTKKITVPTVYTREFIPAIRSHIPTPETAKSWPHLEHLAQHIAPQNQCEIGLLIGYNCPQALMPREVVCGKENEPFAQRTDLGWSIVGYSYPGEHYGDVFGVSHRIIVKQVIPQLKLPDQLKGEVHYVFRTQIKETIAPDDVMKMLESDFNERVEEDSFSQEDVLFLTKLKSGIKQKSDGHFEMSLPFKGQRPALPNNKPCADQLPVGDDKVGEVSGSDPELKAVQVFSTKAREERTLLDRLTKFSDWKRAVKAVACLKRYVKHFSSRKSNYSHATSIEERQEAELFIIKLAQHNALSSEIESIQRGGEVSSKDRTNRLHGLSPFIDENGILRVGGRLTRSTFHPHIKHPAILPKASHISSLLIKYYHEKVHHQGRGITANELRANGVWVMGCSSAVATHIFKCTTCRKYRRCTQEPKMSDLPIERMETTTPFTYSGLDCFGPFYVKEARKELKKYGLLFTCMCSRAVHIEMLDDLTSDAFINALRTFIAIRGNVRQLRCDQGTNFVGARREFTNVLKELQGHEQLKDYGCEFIMNVPSSSHMGGVWERQIRTIRSVLTAILDKSGKRLDTASLRTFLYEVMAIINSRPLTIEHLNDPTSFEPLTPNHILMMKSTIVAPPPGQFVSQDLYLCKRWRQVQFLANQFWARWKKEYLLNLQQRQRWLKDRRNMKVGDIVILQEDNSPRNQ